MRTIRKIKQLFWLSTLCFALMSATFLLMPLASSGATYIDRRGLFLIGATFWTSALTGYLLVIIANRKRKRFLTYKTDDDIRMDCRCGLLTFFSNIIATVFDSILFASIAIAVILFFTSSKNTFLPYLLLSLITLSLNLHAMFNGRIYKVTKYKRIRSGTDYE